MSKKIFVGGIAFKTTDDQLRDLFAQYGAVASATILKDRETGRSRGFGFVEMENDADAQSAISALNGTEFDGRRINVNEAREREMGGGRPSRGPRNDF